MPAYSSDPYAGLPESNPHRKVDAFWRKVEGCLGMTCTIRNRGIWGDLFFRHLVARNEVTPEQVAQFLRDCFRSVKPGYPEGEI